MEPTKQNFNIDLVYVIVKDGIGSKVVQVAKKNGVSGATVLMGKGSVNNRLLRLFSISDTRKEIVLMLSHQDNTNYLLERLNKSFDFRKPNHGIAFTTPISGVYGKSDSKLDNTHAKEGGDKTMYQNIVIIVDKGKAEDVIDAAVMAGSKGGTIINARGSGIHETSKLFSMNIEPEKEMVMILSEESRTDAIIESIRKEMKIDEPGNGVIFVQEVGQTYGIYE